MNGHSQRSILVALGAVATIGVAGAVYADELTTQTQILGFSSMIVVSLLALLQQVRTAEKVEVAAQKVDKVAVTLENTTSKTDKKLDDIAAVGIQTKDNTNSALGYALELTAAATQTTAETTRKPSDIEIARLAREASDKHKESQVKSDAKEKGTTLQLAKDKVDEAGEEIKEKIDDIKT